MKARTQNLSKLTLVLAMAFAVIACKKEDTASRSVSFAGTEYKVLTPYDSTTGRPLSILNDTLSSQLLGFIGAVLPEQQDLRQTHPELLQDDPNVDLHITQTSDVYLTFVSSVTAYKNAIAFYTYPTAVLPQVPADIKTITYVFPNAGVGTKLKAGDKLKIGRFEAGTSIGLVLLRDAFDPTDGRLNNSAVHFCYNDALNPEVNPALRKHVVLFRYKAANQTLIGFENTDRSSPKCDHDFNDAVLYATVKAL